MGLSDVNLSMQELCETIQKQIPKFRFFSSDIGGDSDKRNYIVSNERVEAIGYQTKI